MRSCIVQAPAERPLRHNGNGTVQAGFIVSPSVVESQGRTTCVGVSAANGDFLLGIDVGMPQRWKDRDNTFHGYGAGGLSDGSAINYAHKKTVAFIEDATRGVWIAGSNGAGGIRTRVNGTDRWILRTTGFFGEVNDGGSTDPRNTKSRKVASSGTNIWAAAKRTAAPTNGVARSVDSGVTWTAWSFGTSRNYTALQLSPQYNAIYGAVDVRGAAGTDGVFVLTGITGTVTETRLDNVGVTNPGGLADVRDVFVVQEGTTDCVFVVVGNRAGSDPNRGIWRMRVSHDPVTGFTPATHVTWKHIYTPGASDRINSVVAYKPNGSSAGPIFLQASYFRSSTNAVGTYTITPAAGGGSQPHHVTNVRSLNADDASPSFDVISNQSNISYITKGTRHAHVITYVGEPANENSRIGGTNFGSTDLTISANGQRIVDGGKSTPWICENPWDPTPIWRPFSKGLGALEGGYQSTRIPGMNRFAISDDDRGLYTFRDWGDIRPEWVIAEDIDGVIGTLNSMNGVSRDPVNPNTLYTARDSNGLGYIVTAAFDYNTAHITALHTGTVAAPAIGCYKWVDSNGVSRDLVVTSTHIYRDGASVATYTSTATKTTFAVAGKNSWLHVPDLGIYRSTDNAATWTLWWDKAISNNVTNRYSGHCRLDASDPTALWITFDTGGVWRAQDADISTPGSGVAGSRPSSTSQIAGGSVSASTPVSALTVDGRSGDVWVCSYSPDGTGLAGLHVLRAANPTTWENKATTEYAESALVVEYLNSMANGYLVISTVSNGTMRRMA